MATSEPQGDNCTKYQTCDLQAMTFDELIRALVVKNTTTNCHYLNSVVTLGECTEIETAQECVDGQTLEELLRKVVVLDDCGRPAINFFTASSLTSPVL